MGLRLASNDKTLLLFDSWQTTLKSVILLDRIDR